VPLSTVQSPEWIAFTEEIKRLCGGEGFGWQGLFGDPPNVLFDIAWGANSREEDLEAFPGIIPLGFPWEPLPAEAVPILAAHVTGIAAYNATEVDGASVVAPSIPQLTDPAIPQATDSVARAVNKIGRKFF
jgi:hypothetical protein